MWLGSLARVPNRTRNEWQDMKMAQKEIGLILNVLFSVIGCFVAVFLLSHYVLNDLGLVSWDEITTISKFITSPDASFSSVYYWPFLWVS